jgi:hypothetical protein
MTYEFDRFVVAVSLNVDADDLRALVRKDAKINDATLPMPPPVPVMSTTLPPSVPTENPPAVSVLAVTSMAAGRRLLRAADPSG